MIRPTDPRLLWAIEHAEKGLYLHFRLSGKGGTDRALDRLSDEELDALIKRLIRIWSGRHEPKEAQR